VRRSAPAPAAGFVVELVGVLGSGKTRLARTLAARLEGQGLAVAQPQRRFYTSVAPAVRLSRKALACLSVGAAAPGHTVRLAAGLARSTQEGPADMASRLVQLLVAEAVAREAASRPGVSIVDEGVVQGLWSVGLRGNALPVLHLFDGVAPAPAADLLVVLQVPAEVALDRLSARPSRHSRIQLIPEEDRLAEMKRGMDVLEDVVEWWSSRPDTAGKVCVPSHPEEDSDERDQLLDQICAAARRS